MHPARLLPAALLVLAGCGGEVPQRDPESAPERSRTAATTLPENLCAVVARSVSAQLALEEDRHGAENDADPTRSYCVLTSPGPAGSSGGGVSVTVFVRSYGDQVDDRAADRADEEVERQCDELAEEHPETESSADGTCSHHATTEVSGSPPKVSTAGAVVKLPQVNGVAGISMRVEGDDAGRSRAEVLAIGQHLAAADLTG